MSSFEITQQRLTNQGVSKTVNRDAHAVVKWLGAVQAQDFSAVKWAVGLRSVDTKETEIEGAFTDGLILRTHVMRPTWHFVAAEDIRWILSLTAPRIHGANTPYYRQLELDSAVLRKSNAVLAKAVQGGRQLIRQELKLALQRANIKSEGLRLVYLIMHAELDGILCSGARLGKKFTYASLEDRAPTAIILHRDEALAELAKRYFLSHGPATLQDYRWWSGLSFVDAAAGLEMVRGYLKKKELDGSVYWYARSSSLVSIKSPQAFLLPNYDEYIVGYTNRTAIFDKTYIKKLDPRANPLFQNTIVLDGQIIGTWKRTLKRDSVVVSPVFFSALNASERKAFNMAVMRYGEFLGLSVE